MGQLPDPDKPAKLGGTGSNAGRTGPDNDRRERSTHVAHGPDSGVQVWVGVLAIESIAVDLGVGLHPRDHDAIGDRLRACRDDDVGTATIKLALPLRWTFCSRAIESRH